MADYGLYTIEERGVGPNMFMNIAEVAFDHKLKPFVRNTRSKLFPKEFRKEYLNPFCSPVSGVYLPALKLKPIPRPVQKPLELSPILKYIEGKGKNSELEEDSSTLQNILAAKTPFVSKEQSMQNINKAVQTDTQAIIQEEHVNKSQKDYWTISVINGKLHTGTSEFQRFYDIVCDLKIDIAAMYILEKMCMFFTQYSVPHAELLCDCILYLVTRPIIFPIDIKKTLWCVKNYDAVYEVYRRPGQRFKASDRRLIAAITIQNVYKRYLKEKQLQVNLFRIHAARVFQRRWGIKMFRRSLWSSIQTTYEKSHKQAFARLWNVVKRDRVPIFGFNRIIIQFCTWSVLDVRETIANMSESDLGRALAMQDERVHMIFVMPHLTDERLKYFKTVLEESMFSKHIIESGRLQFVVPEVAKHLTKNSSVAAALYFSRKTIMNLKQMCEGKTALICSDILDQYVVRCSAVLNIPYFGCNIESFNKLFNDPEMEKKLLRDCCIPLVKETMVKPGLFENTFLEFSKIALLNRSHDVWSLWPKKTIAGSNIDSLEIQLPSAFVQSSDMYDLTTRSDKDKQTIAEKTERLMMHFFMSDKLSHVPKTDFVAHWCKHGGVIRSFPNYQMDFRLVEVGISVEWSLQWRLHVSCEAIIKHGRSYGTLVPQQSLDIEILTKHLDNIAKVCSARNIFGCITVSFWCWTDSTTGKQKCVAVHLKPFFTTQLKTASVILMQTRCKIDKNVKDMQYFRSEIPFHMRHLGTSMYGDQKKAYEKFTNVIPTTSTRVAFHMDNLKHGVVEIMSRQGALAKLLSRGFRFDSWTCFGVIMSKNDSLKSGSIPFTCISNSIEEVLELFLGCLVVIEHFLEVDDEKYDNNFYEKADGILRELRALRGNGVQRSGSFDAASKVEILVETMARTTKEEGPSLLHMKAGKVYDTDQEVIGRVLEAEKDVSPYHRTPNDLELLLREYIKLPFGEDFKPEDVLLNIRVAGDKSESSEPVISSGTRMLLMEDIPSMTESLNDPTFSNPVVTPPEVRRKRKQKQQKQPGEIDETDEAHARALMLLERLESEASH